MYDDDDLQKLYNEEYFLERKKPPLWKRRAEFIVDKFNPTKSLDLGSSWGNLVEYLVDNKVDAYGIEGSDYAISQVPNKIKNRIFKVNFNSDKFPFDDNTFDLITGFYVVEHVHNIDFFCDEVFRTLKPNGAIWFLTPNEGMEGRNEFDVFSNKFEEWKKIFEKHNFIVEKFSPHEMMVLKGKLKKFRFYKFPKPLQNIIKKMAYDFSNSTSMKDSSMILKKKN